MTGEAWHDIMVDLSQQKDYDFDCIDDSTYNDYLQAGETVGCGNFYSYIYFLTFQIFVSLILVNLLIAISIQGFKVVLRKNQCRINHI